MAAQQIRTACDQLPFKMFIILRKMKLVQYRNRSEQQETFP